MFHGRKIPPHTRTHICVRLNVTSSLAETQKRNETVPTGKLLSTEQSQSSIQIKNDNKKHFANFFSIYFHGNSVKRFGYGPIGIVTGKKQISTHKSIYVYIIQHKPPRRFIAELYHSII